MTSIQSAGKLRLPTTCAVWHLDQLLSMARPEELVSAFQSLRLLLTVFAYYHHSNSELTCDDHSLVLMSGLELLCDFLVAANTSLKHRNRDVLAQSIDQRERHPVGNTPFLSLLNFDRPANTLSPPFEPHLLSIS